MRLSRFHTGSIALALPAVLCILTTEASSNIARRRVETDRWGRPVFDTHGARLNHGPDPMCSRPLPRAARRGRRSEECRWGSHRRRRPPGLLRSPWSSVRRRSAPASVRPAFMPSTSMAMAALEIVAAASGLGFWPAELVNTGRVGVDIYEVPNP
jgi:hypothetical protein